MEVREFTDVDTTRRPSPVQMVINFGSASLLVWSEINAAHRRAVGHSIRNRGINSSGSCLERRAETDVTGLRSPTIPTLPSPASNDDMRFDSAQRNSEKRGGGGTDTLYFFYFSGKGQGTSGTYPRNTTTVSEFRS